MLLAYNLFQWNGSNEKSISRKIQLNHNDLTHDWYDDDKMFMDFFLIDESRFGRSDRSSDPKSDGIILKNMAIG